MARNSWHVNFFGSITDPERFLRKSTNASDFPHGDWGLSIVNFIWFHVWFHHKFWIAFKTYGTSKLNKLFVFVESESWYSKIKKVKSTIFKHGCDCEIALVVICLWSWLYLTLYLSDQIENMTIRYELQLLQTYFHAVISTHTRDAKTNPPFKSIFY